MDLIIQNLQTIILVSVIAIVVIGQFYRPAAAGLAVVFCIALALIGTEAMDQGHGLGILNYKFSKTGLYIFCAVLAALNLLPLWFKAKRPPRFDHSDD